MRKEAGNHLAQVKELNARKEYAEGLTMEDKYSLIEVKKKLERMFDADWMNDSSDNLDD
jgi:hypothetical protein